MKQQYFVIGLILWTMVSPIRAQEPTLKIHKNEQLRKEHIQDVSVHVEMAKNTYESDELFMKLGDIHYFNNNHREASKWYEKLYAFRDGMIEPEYLLKYSMTLKTIGNEILAAKINNEFMNVSGNITVAFSSFLNNPNSRKERFSWSNDGFLPIYLGIDDGGLVEEDVPNYSNCGRRRRVSGAKNNQNGTSNKSKAKAKDDINVDLHESSVVITKDGNIMYFTRPYNTPNLAEPDQDLLRIYRSKKINGRWGGVEDLSINGNRYSNTHPVLSLDERTLYFSSDRPSSYGKTDIYAVDINDNRFLGKPRNLGPKVNTDRDESFPFVSSDDGLYFSSNGHYGNGGFDVYYVDLKNEDEKLLNLGNPINGPHDDFTFPSFGRFGIKNDMQGLNQTKLQQGFFQMKITMTILDSETGKPIKAARVIVMDDNEVEKMVLKTDGEGSCTFNINRFKAYMLMIEREEYENTYKYIAKGNSNRGLHLKLKRNKV